MKIRVQKSDMEARTIYDFKRLEEKNHLFLPCKIEEEKETLCMSFDLRGMQAFEELKEADRSMKLVALLQAADLEEVYLNYEFSLEPENLYYDTLGRVRVKNRDIIPVSKKNREKYFLKQYQALIGYILEGSMPYEEYLHGDMEILKAGDEIMNLLEPETVQEEKKILLEYYSSYVEKEKKYTKRIEIKKYKWMLRYVAASIFLLAMFLCGFVYNFVWYIIN